MTLDDLELLFKSSNLLYFAFLGGNNGLTKEDRTALSATELLHTESTCTFQRCIYRLRQYCWAVARLPLR